MANKKDEYTGMSDEQRRAIQYKYDEEDEAALQKKSKGNKRITRTRGKQDAKNSETQGDTTLGKQSLNNNAGNSHNPTESNREGIRDGLINSAKDSGKGNQLASKNNEENSGKLPNAEELVKNIRNGQKPVSSANIDHPESIGESNGRYENNSESSGDSGRKGLIRTKNDGVTSSMDRKQEKMDLNIGINPVNLDVETTSGSSTNGQSKTGDTGNNLNVDNDLSSGALYMPGMEQSSNGKGPIRDIGDISDPDFRLPELPLQGRQSKTNKISKKNETELLGGIAKVPDIPATRPIKNRNAYGNGFTENAATNSMRATIENQNPNSFTNGTVGRSASRGARKAIRAGKKAYSFLAKFGLISSIIGFIIIILLVVGALSFFINMPAMVIDNIKDRAMTMWETLHGYIAGRDLPTGKQIESTAQYIAGMGYDLEEWGFANKYNVDSNTGRVNELETKYIPVYLAAEQRCYMVQNSAESFSVADFFSGIADFFRGADNIVIGRGLLNIEDNAKVLLKIQGTSDGTDKATIETKVQVYRRQKEMIITRTGYDTWFSKNGIESYRFKLKYWLEKYTTPLDFYVALHLASRAPEFVASLAENPTQGDGIRDSGTGDILNTRIDINIAALKANEDVNVEVVYLDIDPSTKKVRIGSDGMPVMLTIPEIKAKLGAGETVYGLTNDEATKKVLDKAEAFTADNLLVFTPYITRVINHWYYKEVIYQAKAGVSSYSKDVDVYEMEELPLDSPARVRYQMYQAVQVPGYSGTVKDNSGSSSGGSSGGTGNNNGGTSGGDTGNTGGATNGGTSSGGSSSNSGVTFNPNEQSNGNDRDELAQSTQIASDSGISGGGFFDSILRLLNSGAGWLGTFGGITGMIANLPSQILGSTYGSLSSLITSVMPGTLLSNVSNGWLSGLGYYANGMLLNNTNMNQYLNYGLVANSLGVNNLQNTLNPTSLIYNLGLGQSTGSLMNLSTAGSLAGVAAIAATSLDTTGLTSRMVNMSGVVQNGLTTNTLVNAMYGGLSTQMKDQISSEVLNYSKVAFNGVSQGDSKTIAAGLIAALAKDITYRTTAPFFTSLQSNLANQFNGQYGVQVERLLQNENSKQTTGLTITELEALSQVNDMDTNKIKEVNKDLEKIQAGLEETKTESDELSSLVNKIAKNYADIDAKTFYYIAKTIRTIFKELDNATAQINSFESALNSYSVDERTELQLRTNIERARTAIESSKTSINSLEVTNTRTYGTDLATAGTEIARIIDTNKSKMTPTTAAILIAQGNATSNILSNSGETVKKIDVNTITKFKTSKPDITLTGFLETADQLALLDPNLNGLAEQLEKLNNKLEDVNEANADGAVNKLSDYESNVDKITWMTAAEKTKLKDQARKVRTKATNTRGNISSSNLALMNAISGQVTGITTYSINSFSNQFINLPNVAIYSLLNTVRQIPPSIVESVSRDFSNSLATAVVEQTRNDLTSRVETGLGESLNGSGQLETALQTRTSNAKGGVDSIEEPLTESQDEILTGFYLRETRYRDYVQKSEPILIPYGFEHWKKLLIDNKYISVYSDVYKYLKTQNDGNVLENQGLVSQYGQSIWEATGGTFEETIYAQLSAIDSVDSQYLIRYFKELFTLYGDDLRAAAAAAKGAIRDTTNTVKHPIGWIFRTENKTEIINTSTGESRIVKKSEYEPVSWDATNSGIIYSSKNQPVYGFKAGLDIVSPIQGVVISKTNAKKNELGEIVPGTITIQISGSSNSSLNGMRIILKGGDYTNSPSVGSMVSPEQKIGVTNADNIRIIVIEKDSHSQVSDVFNYIYPPYVTVNN